MNIHEWTAGKLATNNMSARTFFDFCFTKIHGQTCNSTTVKNHAAHYDRLKLVPADCRYVWRVYEIEIAALRMMPAHVKSDSQAYHKAGRR